MRILLMLLVLANLGFFAWQHWYGGDAAGPLPAGRVDTGSAKRLALVGEQETPVVVAEEPERLPEIASPDVVEDQTQTAVTAVDSDQRVTCASLGPFEQLEIAEVARAQLERTGNRAALRETGGQIRSGFWVYLPPFASRAAAEDIEDELRGKNVEDLFIVTGNEQRNAISLGLFSTPERADQRAAEIGRLGYSPRVAERFRDATVYWVDFIETPGDPLEPESLGVMASGETLPEKRSISCDDVAAEAGGA
jgi:hypothetical protein